MVWQSEYYVYMVADRPYGTLLVSITNDLIGSMERYRLGTGDYIARKCRVDRLVYFERARNITDAITQESQIRKWLRKWKIGLIESRNPGWKDLYDEVAARK